MLSDPRPKGITVDLLKAFIALLLFLLFLGFGIQSAVVAPEYAIVLVDEEKGLYFAPHCVSTRRNGLSSTTIGKARQAGLKPESECLESGAFTQEVRSLSGQFLQHLGILNPIESRWNLDGTWRRSSPTPADKIPAQMLTNIDRLAEVAAVIQICISNPAYGALPTEKGLELHGLNIRIMDLVQGIQEHYDDENLYVFYEMVKVKKAADPGLIQYAKETYSYCGPRLFSDLQEYVSQNERLLSAFVCPCKESKNGATKCKPCN